MFRPVRCDDDVCMWLRKPQIGFLGVRVVMNDHSAVGIPEVLNTSVSQEKVATA